MTDTPDDIQRKIDHLEGQRAILGDAIVDEMITKLRAEMPSASETRGTATTRDNYGQNIGVNLGIAIFGQPPEDRERKRIVRYLAKLAASMDQVPLRGLHLRTSQQQNDLSLPKVYTLLATNERIQVASGKPSALTTYLDEDKLKLRDAYHPDHALPDQAILVVEQESTETPGRQRNAEDAPMTLWRAHLAAEAVAHYPRLVLQGDPGGGKSTFLRHLGWLSAQHTLEKLSEADQQRLPAELQTLLPLFVPLPRLARVLARSEETDRPAAAVVTDTLLAVMGDYEASDLSDHLQEVLHRGAALVLFDGLDEVPAEPQPGERTDRSTTLQAVQAFARLNRQARIVITCRTRAFELLKDALSNDWHTATLAPFTLGQMRYFVDVWYDELAVHAAIDADQIATLKQMLIANIQHRERLRDMAETPLLLTMTALVLYNKGELPRDRPKLYEAILELLLGQWDKVTKEGQTLTDVVNWRDWNSERILPVLDRLSYEAHRDATSADGRGRLSKMVVEWALRQHLAQAGMPEDEAARAAARVTHYMEQRSGLLQPAANDYEFAHLTLQEHCAGRHLVRQSNAMALLLEHRTDDRWREPISLGLGTIQEGNPWLIESVLRRLIQRDEQDDTARLYRDLILAAEIGEDRDWAYLHEQGLDVPTIQHDLRIGLTTLLNDATQPLLVAERVRAGFLLGNLGDPRFPVTIEQWKVEAEKAINSDTSEYFCKVAAGTYIIGSSIEEWQHTITFDRCFWIARFPITNDQWQAWVAQGGTPPRHPEDMFVSHSNQPVVAVSNDQCSDFCGWLSRQTGFSIYLPSEEEWEAAARGGDARDYPWGEEWCDDCAASEEDQETRGTHRSPPVGCYPAGAAPCGALDMVGHVWEWTHTRWFPWYRGPEDYEDERRAWSRFIYEQDDEYVTSIVLRGGDCNKSKENIRCSVRKSAEPESSTRGHFQYEPYGFRVILNDLITRGRPRNPSQPRNSLCRLFRGWLGSQWRV